jgi:hypothetical protein
MTVSGAKGSFESVKSSARGGSIGLLYWSDLLGGEIRWWIVRLKTARTGDVYLETKKKSSRPGKEPYV